MTNEGLPDQLTGLKSNLISALGASAAIALTGIALFRYVQGDTDIAIFDAVLAINLFVLSIYTYITKKMEITRYIGAVLSVTATWIAVSIDHITGIYWVFVVAIALFYLLPHRHAIILCIVMLIGNSIIVQPQQSDMQFFTFLVTSTLICLFSLRFAYNTENYHQQLESLTIQDDLTELGNRRAFVEKIDAAIKLLHRYQFPACLIYLDIDHFKLVNDQHGHSIGDQVIKDIARTLKSSLRATDGIFRIGGDEFVIVFNGTAQPGALTAAEKLRSKVGAMKFVQNQNITISLGVTEITDSDTRDECIVRADKALYKAKELGRNRVEFIGFAKPVESAIAT